MQSQHSKYNSDSTTPIGIDISKAVELLKADSIVALPTETVYGLAGNALSPAAIKQIYAAKGRPADNPLIVHLPSTETLDKYVRSIPPLALKLFELFSPGPLTIVMPKTNLMPDITTAGQDTVAIRIPNQPLFLQILNQLQFPLAAPSANRYMSISPTSAEAVAKSLGGRIPYIVDGGDTDIGLESTIISIDNDRINILRHGTITQQQLAKIATITNPSKQAETKKTAATTPGSNRRHYSPDTPFIAVDNVAEIAEIVHTHIKAPDRISRIAVLFPHSTPDYNKHIGRIGKDHEKCTLTPHYLVEGISPSSAQFLPAAAKRLYTIMSELDDLEYDLIIAVKLSGSGIATAINDKLVRAAGSGE